MRALLAWYEAMGADEAIGEVPRDCFAAALAPSPEPEPRKPQALPRVAASPRQDPMALRGLGGEAATLAELEALVAALRGLPAQAHGEKSLLCPRQRGGPHHADRRGAGARRGFARQALRRPRGPAARPHARRDRPRRGASLHHQHRLLAAARQPHADAARGRGLRARSSPGRSSCLHPACWCCSAAPR